ncbi:hypothetical protein FKW77_004066 [Venturia effusa]|uniref:Cytochrome P450 n=1 Tax=Venturia effusa TaxID=50376 RepID=A0A517L552_9PEZI|nr:hypothetical protein FKW77_004066 [Venturia effusa]
MSDCEGSPAICEASITRCEQAQLGLKEQKDELSAAATICGSQITGNKEKEPGASDQQAKSNPVTMPDKYSVDIVVTFKFIPQEPPINPELPTTYESLPNIVQGVRDTFADLSLTPVEHADTDDAERLVEDALNVVNCRPDGEKLADGYRACLQARSIPNQRLVEAFGLNNAFTTSDFQRAKEFVQAANMKVKTVNMEAWKVYAEYCLKSASAKISASGTTVNLADLVQSVTLEISLKFLFNVDENVLKGPEAKIQIPLIAKGINRLWQASKKDSTVKWEDQGELHGALHILLDDACDTADDPDFSESKNNPMNWILPAYETMWRVVLRCLIEVRFRGASQKDEQTWTEALTSHVADPSGAESCDETKLSAKHIAKEALRLYPPTRRIDRKFPDNDTISKADIEACHRNPLLAGEEPLIFDPSRWIQIEAQTEGSSKSKAHEHEQSLGYMPFGSGNFQCPADRTDFGWRMIGVLVGTISHSLAGEWTVVGGELPPPGEALNSGRESCLDLVLKKV